MPTPGSGTLTTCLKAPPGPAEVETCPGLQASAKNASKVNGVEMDRRRIGKRISNFKMDSNLTFRRPFDPDWFFIGIFG